MAKMIDGEKVLLEGKKTTKKIKVNVAVYGLLKTLKEVKEHQGVKLEDNEFTAIVVYFTLNLLAGVNNEKDYKKLFEYFCAEKVEA